MTNTSEGARVARCREAADVAHQLVAYLANKGQAIAKDDYDAIFDVLAKPDTEITSDVEFCFWQAYANAAKLIGDRLDPTGIYYTWLYEIGKRETTPPCAEAIRRGLIWHSYAITAIAMFLMGFLVLLLAWGSMLDGLEKKLTALLTEYNDVAANQISRTRFSEVQGVACSVDGPSNELCSKLLTEVFSEIRANTILLRTLVLSDDTTPASDLVFQDVEKVRAEARQYILFLNSYVYPMLAGALGASVFLMRTIFVSLGGLALTMRTFSVAYLRIAIGSIAGIVIGWLVTDEVAGSISLAPLALAFVAGYAVEIIYAILDRVVAVFTRPDTEGTKAR
jgi:hypothetical protein